MLLRRVQAFLEQSSGRLAFDAATSNERSRLHGKEKRQLNSQIKMTPSLYCHLNDWGMILLRCAYPPDMLDASLSVDESKLRYTAGLPGGQEMIFSLIRRDSSAVIPGISKRFGLNDMLSDQTQDRACMASFVDYFGVLTLAGETAALRIILKVSFWFPSSGLGTLVSWKLQLLVRMNSHNNRSGPCAGFRQQGIHRRQQR